MIAAVIPMRDHHEDTLKVLTHLECYEELDRVLLIDNESEDECCREWLDELMKRDEWPWRSFTLWYHPGRDNFYRMWNDGRRWAALEADRAGDDECFLLHLNNDLGLWPGTAAILAGALRASEADVWITYPDWKRSCDNGPSLPYTLQKTKGTRNSGGMSGFCFMMDIRAMDEHDVPMIDERYELLCGDGDLVERIEERGGTAACVVGLPLDHRESTTQHDDKNREWTKQARHRDRGRRSRREREARRARR